MSTLAEFLKREGLTQPQFAAKVGCSQTMISRLCQGRRGPGLRLATAIERATGGAVPASSWTDPPAPSTEAAE